MVVIVETITELEVGDKVEVTLTITTEGETIVVEVKVGDSTDVSAVLIEVLMAVEDEIELGADFRGKFFFD